MKIRQNAGGSWAVRDEATGATLATFASKAAAAFWLRDRAREQYQEAAATVMASLGPLTPEQRAEVTRLFRIGAKVTR
jgi:hypothetical protein